MEIEWPEKIVIVVALFVAIGMALFWTLLAAGVGTAFDARLNISALHWFVECEVLFAVPLWMTSRVIHLVLVGWRHWRT